MPHAVSAIEPPPVTPRLYALVPCAGHGERAGTAGPKQYEALANSTVVGHTLAALSQVSRLHRILVVLSPTDAQFEVRVPGFDGWIARCGGATRADSVAAGLQELSDRGASATDWVLVHDAARCLIRAQWVDALIDACLGDAVGGLLALPVADTLKREEAARVSATVDRARIWQAQTPQMFRLGLLSEALTSANQRGIPVTDEASAIEAMGHAPLLVRGDLENFKVTFPPDFELAERLLRTR
ncbi:MAG: 2-C-methyl-D-erythritol 4-phosphate cytidylyltransferase [Burkholderiaceae bacterium]